MKKKKIFCKNLCHKFKSKSQGSRIYYKPGKRYCKRCRLVLDHEGARCPCCNATFRVDARNKSGPRLGDIKLLAHLTVLPSGQFSFEDIKMNKSIVDTNDMTCTCRVFRYKKQSCQHLRATRLYLKDHKIS